jgi:hypothetical protein
MNLVYIDELLENCPTNDNMEYIYLTNKNAQLLKIKDKSNVIPISGSFCTRFRENLEQSRVPVCGDDR